MTTNDILQLYFEKHYIGKKVVKDGESFVVREVETGNDYENLEITFYGENWPQKYYELIRIGQHSELPEIID